MTRLIDLASWVGRSEERRDVASIGPMLGLQAVLDRDLGLREGTVPALGHWLYFLPTARQSELDGDGHPRRGGFLPPVDLPRRMWAGGRIAFLAPVPIGASIERLSTIARIEEKTGGGGDRLVFVTVEHRISSAGHLLIEERQDIVYRGAPAPSPTPSTQSAAEEPRKADAVRRVMPTPMLLFRYSALTFNAHRIHYDRDYTRDVEGYPSLVVHGPLLATLLMDLFTAQRRGGARVFEFRARRPLFDGAAFVANLAWRGDGGADLWASGPNGEAAMTASVLAV